MGYPVLDPLASVLICAFILKAAIDIFMDAVNKMVDKACDDSVVDALQKCIYSQNGVLGISSLQTRWFGSKILGGCGNRSRRKADIDRST